jgi:Tfp pilus assembly protein PilO
MSGNEKKLLAAFGSVVGVYFGYMTLDTLYITPRRELAGKVVDEEKRLQNLLDEMDKTKATNADWARQTQRTLSLKRDEAQLVFRDQIAKLLEKHQLQFGHSLSPQQPREIKKDSRKGFVELPLQMSLEGKLANLTAFLEDVQKLPYYVSVDKLVLNASAADQGLAGASTGKDKKGPRPGFSKDGPTLRAELRLSSLVLPKVADVVHLVCDPGKEGVQPALKPRDSEGSYATVAATNVFRPYAVPEPPQVKVVETKHPETRPVTPVTPPPPKDTRVLVGTPSLNGEPVAFLRDELKKSDPPEELRLNAAVCENGKGKLVLVHPKGIVIRIAEPNDAPPKNYFVALGQKISEREELSPQAHPDVYAMLSRVISQ